MLVVWIIKSVDEKADMKNLMVGIDTPVFCFFLKKKTVQQGCSMMYCFLKLFLEYM